MLRQAIKTVLINGRTTQSGGRQIKSNAPINISKQQDKWDLFAGVLVERLPKITKSLNPIEKEYLEHLNQLEFEQSLKSDFEIREEKEKLIATLQQQGKMEVDMDVAVQQNAQDLKDAWKEELVQFQLANRITQADQKNDTKSLNRKLEDPLILLVEQKIGNENLLLLPQGKRRDGETMRQTAERVLQEQCGNQLAVQFYGNAPCGFYKYKYPKNQRNETIGAKIFFFRSAYKTGNVQLSSQNNDKTKSVNFEWLNKDEMFGKIKQDSYTSSVAQFLL